MLVFLSFSSPAFYLYFIYFVVASICTFLLPGIVLLNFRPNKLNSFYQFVLGLGVGIVVFALLSYLSAWLSLQAILPIYMVFFNLLFFRKKLWRVLIGVKYKAKNIFSKLAWLIIILGSLLQLLAVFGSGMRYADGLRFYWLNGADGIFHLSLMQSLLESFPPQQPGAWNLPVTNYHYLSNLLIAKLAQIWHLPLASTFFQYLPLVLAPLMGLSLATLLHEWQAKKSVVSWGLFLLYFSADSGWLFELIINHAWRWQTSTIDSGIIQFLNMPQAMAKLALLIGLLLFTLYRKERNGYFGLLATVMFLSLVSLKVYFGIFIALGYGFFAMAKLLQRGPRNFFQKEKLIILLLILLAVGSFALFWPSNGHSGGLFFAPLNWPKLFVSQLNWSDFMLRTQVYEATHNTRNILILELGATAVFLVAIFGIRLLGFLSLWRSFRQQIHTDVLWLIYPATVLLVLLGLNTLQVSGTHNVFNFFVVALSILTLLTAIVLGNLRQHWVWIALIVAFTLPRTIYTTYCYLRNYHLGYDYNLLSNKRLEAYGFVANNFHEQIIQGHPRNILTKETPQLHSFTKQRAFLDGIGILSSHNQPIARQKSLVASIFDSEEATISAQALLESNIDLVFLDKKNYEELNMFLPKVYYKTKIYSIDPILKRNKIIYENEEIKIYQVDKNSLQEFLAKNPASATK